MMALRVASFCSARVSKGFLFSFFALAVYAEATTYARFEPTLKRFRSASIRPRRPLEAPCLDRGRQTFRELAIENRTFLIF